MADEEQLEILKSGVEEWNRWRKESPRLKIELQEANLEGASLEGANLNEADLQEANLQGARLGHADLQGANLVGASLSEADLQVCTFWRTNLRQVNLRRADIIGPDLWMADLKGADMRGARVSSAVFAAVASLDQAMGLDSCHHLGPSVVDHQTLAHAQGQVPEAFLKGCGFKDWEIAQAKLHDSNLRPDEVIDITYKVANLRTKGPIQVNSLFISYSREDAAFVDFIEKKLDEDGIRSWRDVHHMTAGPVEQQIERAIDLNGTVLLVLSKNSLGSTWVEWEVARAEKRQRELQVQGKDTHVLCPVAIDGTWEQSRWPGPLMNQITKYNILDFSKWETNDAEGSYQKLKAGIATYYTS